MLEQVGLAGDSLVEDALDVPIPREARKLAAEVAVPVSGWETLIQKCRRVDWKIDPRFSVFADETIFRHGAEKFRTLRSRLYQIGATRPLKRVLLTSSIPEEGKTFISSNLAQSIARQENRKVLLIDADLRASRLHLAMGAPGTPGLSDYLSGEADETQVIQVGGKGNLCFIPGGNLVSNPSELLLADRMKILLDHMTPLFDWIVVDSPPAIAVHDASVLADLCDGVLFVVRAGSTDYEIAQRAASEFRPESLLGVVLNRVDKDDAYGEYYYGYSSDSEGRQKSS
ncbi:MAG TPA: CpsD/CapB family tyrosine-protein kinase [Candidatus Sulfotelmatobacter sp.]|nr:CpsD/CapB family tyrosine-protein kinase [Candidatus Sulfotelmatobacter sp.]